jgi:hypothetical protein
MIATAGTWAVLGLLFTGAGLSIRRAFGLRLHSADDWLAAFWLGWSGVIALLQIWHLALPVDGRAAALAAVLGAAGLIWNRRAILDDLRLRIGQRRTWAALAGLLLAAILLSNRAIGAPAIHDTGLYHVPTVRWIETYPVVPGLGNLHDRLAFNSAYLLYAALLDQGFWDRRAQHLAGGLLLLALFAQGIVSLGRLLRHDLAHRAADSFGALIGVAMLQQALLPDVASLSPDLPIFALTVALTGRFLAFLERRDVQGREANFAIFALVVPALIGVTVKLSFAAFAGALIPLALAVWLRRMSPSLGLARSCFIICHQFSTCLAM